MEAPSRIRYAAQRLKDGHRVNRITVRGFISHFGAERRGAAKVEAIRGVLDSLDLETEPNFETAWIDEPIQLRLKGGGPITDAASVPIDSTEGGQDGADLEDIVLEGTPSALKQVLAQSELAPTSAEPDVPAGGVDPESSDPTFRIGSLPAANKRLISVNQDDLVARAATLMLQHDFSQLPVMQGEREVKGVVTWKSIGSRKAVGSKCERVADCREDARIVDSNRTLFDAIPIIVEYGYVLVRQHDRRISGIVTASDLSLQFPALAEPFLLLREIELHVRRLP
ncbi:MAG: CBS domain-containing protein [Rhodospirillales bacterium]|nr:CBS domain-containing protein [Rhodospirillales bacterium]